MSNGFIELQRGKPFEAVRVQIISWPGLPTSDVVVEKLSRDEDGRLRTEHYELGKRPFQIEMLRIGPEDFAASENAVFEIPSGVQPQWINIEDPCTLRRYFIRPAKYVATWMKIASGNYLPVCGNRTLEDAAKVSNDPRLAVSQEILPHRLFAGVDAGGSRSAFYVSNEVRKAGGKPYQSDERWCSSDLAAQMALLLTDAKVNDTVKITLKRVLRRSPDPDLFHVPTGYSLVEINPDGTPIVPAIAATPSAPLQPKIP